MDITLVRFNLPSGLKRNHDGPKPGGIFFAAKEFNDVFFYDVIGHAQLSHLLRNGQVWMQNAEKPGTWEQIKDVSQVPRFIEGWGVTPDLVDYCFVRPFMPEFYFIPKNARGGRLAKRLGAQTLQGRII